MHFVQLFETSGCYLFAGQILHLYEANQDEWMLFVWDGTDAPPLQLYSE